MSKRSLYAALHDGILERVELSDGEARLVIDVPHVRAHAGLPGSARFVLRLSGSPYLTAARWSPPTTPRPTSSDPVMQKAWSRLGTMRSVDWDAFVRALERADVHEVDLVPASETARVAIEIWGSFGPRRSEETHLLRLEADSSTFERESGEALDVEALIALGDAYWAAWAASRPA